MKKPAVNIAVLAAACVFTSGAIGADGQDGPPSAITLADAPAQGFAAKTSYISPNNDGVKDALAVPFTITDKRDIGEWRLVVRDEKGAIIRTIRNKDTRPALLSLKEIWRIITTPKKSVDIPASVVWDGTDDAGAAAPDGRYWYSVEAADDNGNKSESERRIVIVDSTPPEIVLSQPAAEEKFFGEGDKASLSIEQTGSAEELWTARILDTAGTAVRTWTLTDSGPVGIVWDGRGAGGGLVPDGVYSYSIKSTDRAGNSAEERITNIVYSGDKPAVGIAISGSRYFSPDAGLSAAIAGTDGAKDVRIRTITMIPSVPKPSGGNSLLSWRVEVISAGGRDSGSVYRTFSGAEAAPPSIIFDGTDDNGVPLAEGRYEARITASYLNGYRAPAKSSPEFIIDRTKPSASISLADNIFSPDGNGDKDAISVTQILSPEDAPWTGEVLNKEGRAVRRFSLGGRPASELKWNGLNDAGRLCADGDYTYRVSCTDLAGNSALVTSLPFTLDNSATELIVSVSPEAFSPNGDKIRDTVAFNLTSKSGSGIVRYTLVVTDAENAVMRTFRANGAIPSSIAWDGRTDAGKIAPDGTYSVRLDAVSRNGSVSQASGAPFLLDNTAPRASVSAAYLLFAPMENSSRRTLPLEIGTDAESRWTGEIRDAKGAAVRNFVWYNGAARSFAWDGTDDSGNVVKDGVYRFVLSAEDPAGNGCRAEVAGITVDTRPASAWVTAVNDTVAPNGMNTREQVFGITATPMDGPATWTFKVVSLESPDSTPEAVWTGESAALPEAFTWNGRLAGGGAADGVYFGTLEVLHTRGLRVYTESPAFVCSAKPPVISVSARPALFSPDNDGVDDDAVFSLRAFSYLPFESWSFEVFNPVSVGASAQDVSSGGFAPSAAPFWTTGGKSRQITGELVWGGKSDRGELVESAMDYPFLFTVTDTAGQTSKAAGVLHVDVLLINDGGKLKMRVPAIIFRADHADFVSKTEDPAQGIEQSVIDNNMRVLRRIAEILNKFRDYTVVIEGHAHNMTGTEDEETSTAFGNIPLVPLSIDRAAFVRRELARLGVSANRMTTVGLGGRKPVADPSRRDDWWRDRRVEFILNK